MKIEMYVYCSTCENVTALCMESIYVQNNRTQMQISKIMLLLNTIKISVYGNNIFIKHSVIHILVNGGILCSYVKIVWRRRIWNNKYSHNCAKRLRKQGTPMKCLMVNNTFQKIDLFQFCYLLHAQIKNYVTTNTILEQFWRVIINL